MIIKNYAKIFLYFTIVASIFFIFIPVFAYELDDVLIGTCVSPGDDGYCATELGCSNSSGSWDEPCNSDEQCIVYDEGNNSVAECVNLSSEGIFACNCKNAVDNVDYHVCVASAEQCEETCIVHGVETFVRCLKGCEATKQGSFCTDQTGLAGEELDSYQTPSITLEVPFGNTGGANDPVEGLSGYVQLLYAFSVPFIAIIAVIMIMFGGFKWATAAGNSSMVASAKKTITNAIIGLVLALTSFLLLYTINPALVSLQIFEIAFVKFLDESNVGDKGDCPDAPDDSHCTPRALSELAGEGFGDDLEKMSRVCWRESRGVADVSSTVDKCQDGKAFSFGFFQINLIANGSHVPGMDCKNIFEPATSLGKCVKFRDTNGDKLRQKTEMCVVWSCKVVDQAKYDACSQYLKTPAGNTKTAVELYKISGLQPWVAPWACNP